LRTKFGDFGTISEVNVKEKNGVYFAFVEFESHNEALKAVDRYYILI
jgi:RNA recognition motif-containing protein